MAETVDELTVNFTENDVLVTKELDKVVLTKGAWSTILFRYQDWEPAKNAYSADRYTIRRFQKRNGVYQQKSKFNISSADQARALISALEKWLPEAGE